MAMSGIEKIYHRYRVSIFGYFYRKGGDYHLAEELTQETFCRALVSIKGFRGESTLSTWLFRIAFYVYAGYLRGHPGETNLPLERDIPDGRRDGEPSQALDGKENIRLVRSVLERLPVEYRAVIVLREIEGLSFEEIGVVVDKNPATVRVILFRAKKKFRKYFSQLVEGEADE